MSVASQTNHRAQATAGAYRLDPSRSSVEFHVRHFWGLKIVSGRFQKFEGTYDPKSSPAAQLTIDAASLDTKNKRRDQHLRSADFFDVEHHPQIRFSASADSAGPGRLGLAGTLAVAGQELPLELDAAVLDENGELEVSAETEVDQRRLGMTWSPGGMLRGPAKLIVKARLVPETALDDMRDASREAAR